MQPLETWPHGTPASVQAWAMRPGRTELPIYLDLWLQLKVVLVIGMSGMHGFFARCVKDFAADRNTRSARFYRIANEVPALLMVFIVILVIVQPFS
jgi:protoporphyrinogen IX oxidase